MAPKNKAKAAGISASSFFDLKAELAKQEEEFTKNKAAGKATALIGGIKRPDKKLPVWARSNAGVKDRAVCDIELEEISKPTLDSARAILERKAKVYDHLRKGKSGGLNEKQYETLLVDFDSKPIDSYESDSDDVDESFTVPRQPAEQEDDPVIEYEDEFGRLRTGRRSEVPRHLLPQPEDAQVEEDIDPFVVYNPVDHFPVYEPSAERVAAIEKEFAEDNNPLNVHYDASHEVRSKGAGFYQFSGDEETRKKQMEELRRVREETEKTREELGATNLKPGEAEGMRASGEDGPGSGSGSGSGSGVARSRAMEKRKRELEERRKMLDAKRRKLVGSTPADVQDKKIDITASGSTAQTKSAPPDPIVTLETQTLDRKSTKPKPPLSTMDSADAFLAQLEQDVLKGSKL